MMDLGESPLGRDEFAACPMKRDFTIVVYSVKSELTWPHVFT
jgi:hypothetical protein